MIRPTVAAPTIAALALVVSGHAGAQAYRCAMPSRVDDIRPDLASAGQPRRLLPIGGYTLAVTWAPQYCHEHAREPSARFQCGAGNRFGFTLHGLWPDGVDRDWPQYCTATPLLPAAVIRASLCATPSAQLLQHEWSKHGTCMAGTTPAAYFRRSTGLYGALRFPDMDALSRRPLTAVGLARAVAAANPGMTPGMMRVTANRRGWLDEIWFCLDRRFAPARCPAHQGGLPAASTVRVWRGPR